MGNSFKGTVAVIQFPGVNCEYETAAAVRTIGLAAEIFRWNEDPSLLDDCTGIILPGGFSYQDRIRAGVVAAKDRIMDAVSELARKRKLYMRDAAYVISVSRVAKASRDRGWV